MSSSIYQNFIQFLQDDLSMSQDALAIVEKAMKKNVEPLPMVLWKYGLVTLDELDRIYDWLDTV